MRLATLLLSTMAVALILGSTTAGSAPARKKAPTASSGASAVEECCKQQGGTFEPVSRCTIYDFSEHGSMSKQDAFRQCISSKTGLRRDQIPIHQRYIDRPGANY
jgi:hypothetical protein